MRNRKLPPPSPPPKLEASGFRREAARQKRRRDKPVAAEAATLSPQEVRALAESIKATVPQKILLTPERATALLERNLLNRPISDQHVQRIARQIIERKWKFNGDTIKLSDTGDVLDGQHRLWAVIEANLPVETVIVYGIAKDAFATIDTVRRLRSGGDTIALSGQRIYRTTIAASLSWLLRYQRGTLEDFKRPTNRIENSDIEAAWAAHPGIERAVTTMTKARRVANPGITSFCYYVMVNQNPDIAELFAKVLLDPAGVAISHPFFRLRSYFLAERQKTKDPIMTIALTWKAANAVAANRAITSLAWRSQGAHPEPYPVLHIGPGAARSSKAS